MENKSKSTTILFLSWRDIKAPKKGGAEVFTHEMLARRNSDLTRIIHFSPIFEQASPSEIIDGVLYKRQGNIFTVIIHACIYYLKHRNKIDFVVDQCNTHRFFTPLWVKRDKRIFFIHQMTREIWLRQLKKPFSVIGMALESAMTKLYKKTTTMTVSNSTKSDLVALGFNEEIIHVLPEGIDFEPWAREEWLESDVDMFTYAGRYATYKGIDASIEAFCRYQQQHEKAILNIIGKKNEDYIKDVLEPIIEKYQVSHDKIIYHGFVSEAKKLELMSQSHCLLFPSEREGWGLTITEGAAVGTPSIVYDSPGLRDAVLEGSAGFMTKENTVEGILDLMELSTSDLAYYEKIRTAAYEFAKQLNWDKTAQAFDQMMVELIEVDDYE